MKGFKRILSTSFRNYVLHWGPNNINSLWETNEKSWNPHKALQKRGRIKNISCYFWEKKETPYQDGIILKTRYPCLQHTCQYSLKSYMIHHPQQPTAEQRGTVWMWSPQPQYLHEATKKSWKATKHWCCGHLWVLPWNLLLDLMMGLVLSRMSRLKVLLTDADPVITPSSGKQSYCCCFP